MGDRRRGRVVADPREPSGRAAHRGRPPVSRRRPHGVRPARSPPVTSRARWGDRGQVAGFEALPFGLLVFVVGALVVASGWAVVDVKQTLAVATREGARTFVEGRLGATGEPAASRAVEETVRGLGRDPDR